ncbi:hypothetical protein ABFS82_08G030700 [Erythranthe guttata]
MQDQYVNHIMNETGATVLLRGRGSGYSENVKYEETQQPLHLLLSSNDAKSLEHAKLLAENLLDTISAECAASRVSSSKVYGAVPPPPQLQVGVQSPGRASETNDVASLSSSALIDGSSGLPQSSTGCYPHGLQSGTSYIGYGGIYPQATPLQQVALALRRSTSPVTATVAPATTAASTGPPQEVSDAAKYKRSQKRKFQELPAAAKGPANINQKNIQVSEFPMPRDLTSHVGARDISVVQDPKKFVKPSTNGMPPPPPRSLPPSFSAPPKFSSTTKVNGDNKGTQLSNSEVVPDTLIKLMEYGDDDDDDDDDLEETAEQPMEKHSSNPAIPKPFWAV